MRSNSHEGGIGFPRSRKILLELADQHFQMIRTGIIKGTIKGIITEIIKGIMTGIILIMQFEPKNYDLKGISDEHSCSDQANSPIAYNWYPTIPSSCHQNLEKNESAQIARTLSKPYEIRSNAEIKNLYLYAITNNFLKSAAQNVGIEFVKGILKTAKLAYFQAGQLIYEHQQQITTISVVLEGSLQVHKPLKEGLTESKIGETEMFAKLTSMARKEIRQKQSKKNHKKQDMPFSFVMRQIGVQSVEILSPGDSCGAYDRCESNKYSVNVIAKQKCSLLIIEMKAVFEWLNYSLERKLFKSMELIRQIGAFSALEKAELQEIIQGMQIKRCKKNALVFKQGDPVNCLYMLEEGSLSISKNTQLFRENPNELYIDRRKILNLKDKWEQNVLPYANLTDLYNYRPMSKPIQLGSLTPFCLFGEEEIVGRLERREVTISCNSLQATYYEIQLDRLGKMLGDKMGQFLNRLEASIREKLMYRQNTYSVAVNLENGNSLDYFYYQGDSPKPAPRKYKLQKINASLTVVSKQEASTLANPSAHPYFNTFNFRKMIPSKERSHSSEKAKAKRLEEYFNPEEQRVVGKSHTWRQIRQRVQEQGKISRKTGSCKLSISFKDPLIDEKHFRTIQEAMHRLDRDQRNKKFTKRKKTAVV